MPDFKFTWDGPAQEVIVTGTFDDWTRSVRLDRAGEHFEKTVSFSDSSEPIYYMFLVDDRWSISNSAPQGRYGDSYFTNILSLDHASKAEPEVSQPTRKRASFAVPGKDGFFEVIQDWYYFYNITQADLDGKPKKEIERQNILHEIVQSELNYRNDLQVSLSLYREALVADPFILRPATRDNFIHTVFQRIEAVQEVNKTLLDELQSLLIEQGPWIVGFSDVFHRWLRQAETTYVEYCSAYPQTAEMVREEKDENPRFRIFLNEMRSHKRSRRLELGHYLKAPVTRIQRYGLLLHTVRNRTTEAGEERAKLDALIDDLTLSLRKCDQAIDESVQAVEVRTASAQLVLGPSFRSVLSLDLPQRKVFKQGDLQMLSENQRFDVHAVLFDHFLVLGRIPENEKQSEKRAKSYQVLEEPIALSRLHIDGSSHSPVRKKGVLGVFSSSSKDKLFYPFQITHMGHKTYVLYTSDIAERREWCNKIEEARAMHVQAASLRHARIFEDSSMRTGPEVSDATIRATTSRSSISRYREAILQPDSAAEQLSETSYTAFPATSERVGRPLSFRQSFNEQPNNPLNPHIRAPSEPLGLPSNSHALNEQSNWLPVPEPIRPQSTSSRRQSPVPQEVPTPQPLPLPQPQPFPMVAITPQPSGNSRAPDVTFLTSDLVRDMKLETTFVDGKTLHTYYTSDTRISRRRLRVEEFWTREQLLGRGTYGTVYLESCVLGPKKGQVRAVKQIAKEEEHSSSVDYSRELMAMSKFSHDRYVHCFVQSYGWWETTESIFIAMEYLKMGDLQKYLVVPFPEEVAKDITSQLVEGLVFMHDNGFAHRDLKPGNILVLRHEPEWWVKISDFGISKRVADESTSLRTQIGTRSYLAPEVQGIFTMEDMALASKDASDGSPGGQPSYTLAVDVWSLGTIVHRMLTNRLPFQDPWNLAQFVTLGKPFPAEHLAGAEVSVEGMRFVERCLTASPAGRPTSQGLQSDAWVAELLGGSEVASIETWHPPEQMAGTPGAPAAFNGFEENGTGRWTTM